jgi:two-component system sensor histidine kinase PilS (NtrC family)
MLTACSALIFKFVNRLNGFSFAQILGDIIFITGIIHITGGMESPFVFLYFLSIISGSTLYYQKGGLIAALLSTCSYLFLFLINTDVWPQLHIGHSISNISGQLYYRTFLNLFSFFIIAFLSNQLASRLKMAGEEIKQKEDSIEDLQALQENIIQSVTSGLITADLGGNMTSVNRSAEKILRIPVTEVLQSSLVELFPFPPVKEYLESDAVQKDEEYSRFEITYHNRQSKEMILGMTLSLLRNKRGERTGFLCTFQDLTLIKALEEKMRKNEQLAMIGELSAGIAHEIRNPLASMSGSIQLLRSELDLDDENRRLMNIIIRETDRLNNLIGNFLMYARPNPLKCKPVHLKDLLDETITLLQNSKKVGDFIRIDMDVKEDVEAFVDSMAIRQVFWNLTTNAVEAMPDGGTLRVEAARLEERKLMKNKGIAHLVRVTVSDTGGGIDPGIREKLFFPFHTTKEKGSGLGLAIVHQIIHQHGGWVDVVNQPGEGTAFHLYLPEAA